jgi:hypothetical protein
LPPILSFSDQELAALRAAAAKLSPWQRDQFLRDVACELKRCRKIEPGARTGHTVAQVATAVQRRLSNDTRPLRAAEADRPAVHTAMG